MINSDWPEERVEGQARLFDVCTCTNKWTNQRNRQEPCAADGTLNGMHKTPLPTFTENLKSDIKGWEKEQWQFGNKMHI